MLLLSEKARNVNAYECEIEKILTIPLSCLIFLSLFLVLYLILGMLVIKEQMLHMGLSPSPTIWQSYINAILGSSTDI